MATSLLLACGLNEHTLPPYIHISEESNVDGSFLLSSILAHRLRIPNSATILVCLQNNFAHYASAGMRLGCNLNMFKGKTLGAIDVVTDLATDFTNSKWTGKDGRICDVLAEEIRTEMAKSFQGKTNCTVIIDNFAILLNLGATRKEVSQFGMALQVLGRDSGDNVAVIAKLSNCDVFDVMDSNLENSTNFHIRVIRLKSGNFKEVDGRLSVCRTSLNGKYEVVQNRKDVLYKVNERNVKIFNPGEIGVKI